MDVIVISGVTYGFSIIPGVSESPYVPFKILCIRFQEGVDRLGTSLAFYQKVLYLYH